MREKIFVVCPKSGRIKGIRRPEGFAKMLYPFIGIFALLWIVFRVVPKPQRVNYPCVKAAMPFASTFLVSLIAAVASRLLYLKMKITLRSKPLAISLVAIAAILPFILFPGIFAGQRTDIVYPVSQHPANSPIGVGKGIFPGRVVWAFNPNATNQNCNPHSFGHSYYITENSNQTVIDQMVSQVLQGLTEKSTDSAAWNAIFVYHNNTMGKGLVGYKAGEKILIKTNATSAWDGNYNPADMTPYNGTYYGISETSPQMILSVLRQLVYKVGVNQSDIYVGDPLKHIYKHAYDILHPEFPNVHYLDHSGFTGRETVVKSTTAKILFSDKGTVLKSAGATGTPVTSDYLYTVFETCEYMINLPQLKGHRYAGMTMFAKNHFGSQTQNDASHLHGGLVAPGIDSATRAGYGLYRVQVDLMGHDLLGKKNLVYLMDGLWGTDYELDVPVKWAMAPFNNRYSSSVFASLDPVAIESVGYDFLRSEFTAARGLGTWVQMVGVDDYLHQAADSSNWPAGIKYDPMGTGNHIKSLGVHEHWNNATDMQYSRNLGGSEGIELVKIGTTGILANNKITTPDFVILRGYPNPFNPSTMIEVEFPHAMTATLRVYSIDGKCVKTLFDKRVNAGKQQIKFDASNLPSGIYLVSLKSEMGMKTIKMAYTK